MERNLPPEYADWHKHERELRRLSTPELVEEIQDGAPDRRLAAISVIDLDDVSRETIEDWIRTLPEPEANELAGAIPAQRIHASTEADLRWVAVSQVGFERRRLPTFLVMLFSSLEAIESRDPATATKTWHEVASWVAETYRQLAAEGDREAIGDLSLFVFENYLDREPLFESFAELLREDEDMAMHVSANPAVFLIGLPLAQQKTALEAAQQGGGLAFETAWRSLHESGR
ncbi:MAG: hypothetical protein U5Q44_03170 [Dehalococcoidia bacterium]|nr:hypothetical protein [Dehalococcoidia bacterium]